MGDSRDCGAFTASLNISGGLQDHRNSLVFPDSTFHASSSKALLQLKAKYEQIILDEWCEAIGWPAEKREFAVIEAQQRREDLLKQDTEGRRMRHEQRADKG